MEVGEDERMEMDESAFYYFLVCYFTVESFLISQMTENSSSPFKECLNKKSNCFFEFFKNNIIMIKYNLFSIQRYQNEKILCLHFFAVKNFLREIFSSIGYFFHGNKFFIVSILTKNDS